MAIRAPEGTKDLLPKDSKHWNCFKEQAFKIFACYGYVPIETPIFEQTELFVRGIGEATDVVSKEMFQTVSGENMRKRLIETEKRVREKGSLSDSDYQGLLAGEPLRSKSRLSLRPEGTAGVVRAVVQHDLVPQGAPPVKLTYAGPMFRAERPQKGRLRQFNQVGVECLGADEPSLDAEVIIMLMRFFTSIGIPQESMRLLLNSMGCDSCRPQYRDIVKDYIQSHKDQMCEECMTRAELNPLRAFDCKNEQCVQVMNGAPKITDHLCSSCSEHYYQVKCLLEATGLTYEEDPRLVRGLDYYTRTVFEVQVVEGLGSQNAIGGGGRYDKLAEEVGGRPTSGLGFALGYERCVLALEAAGVQFEEAKSCDIFIACVDESVRNKAFIIAQSCRDAGLAVDLDHQSRSLKSQFKLAGRLGVGQVIIVGPDELEAGTVKFRDMESREEKDVSLENLDLELTKLAKSN